MIQKIFVSESFLWYSEKVGFSTLSFLPSVFALGICPQAIALRRSPSGAHPGLGYVPDLTSTHLHNYSFSFVFCREYH